MKNEMETKLIDFEGGEFLGVKNENGKIYLGIKKSCVDIGLTERQAKTQIKDIKENLVLNEGVHNFVLVQNEGGRKVKREVTGIEEKFVTAWLMQIKLTPTFKKENPNTFKRLIKYQIKAVDVLHNAFMGTKEMKKEFYNDLGLKGEIVNLKNEVKESNNKIIELNNKVGELITNSTINSRQSQKLLSCARDRVRELLGNAHSTNYKKYSRVYFKNLWLNFCDIYEVGSYKDLCPIYYEEAFDFIENWEYKEVA